MAFPFALLKNLISAAVSLLISSLVQIQVYASQVHIKMQ